jgi:hypothetical protein
MVGQNSTPQPKSTKISGQEVALLPEGRDIDEILGWVVHYTIGRGFTVPHNWLTEKGEEYGIPSNALPNKTSPKYAFGRMAKEQIPRLMNEQTAEAITFKGHKPSGVEGDMINLDVSDRRREEFDGDTLCRFVWDAENQSPRLRLIAEGEAETIDEAFDWYEMVMRMMDEQFEKMQTHKLARDVSRAIRDWIKGKSDQEVGSTRMRDAGAVYFVPRGFGDVLSGWEQLARDIDSEWKVEHNECAIDAIEVADNERQQDMLERKARKHMHDLLDGVIETALDEIDEDMAATQAVNKASDDLVQAENIAVEHNALLSVEVSIQNELEDWKDRVKSGGQKQEVIEAAIDEVGI